MQEIVNLDRLFRVLVMFLGVFIGLTSAYGEELTHDNNSTREEKKLSRITVVGNPSAVNEVPGSAHFLNKENLEKSEGGFDDIHKALRQVPGVNIQEEEGFGLRPNIGLRGAPSERSENITLMEDGVLIAPAPYSAPAAYYFPPLGRMEGVEVLKGAGQIKYGPRTTGGSLNLLSTSIPRDFSLNLKGRVGEDDTLNGHFSLGDTYKYGGFLLETYQAKTDGFKRLDGGGDTGFDLQDYQGKFRINTDTKVDMYQELEVKLGTYDQDANETYVGLTKEDFKNDPYRRYRASHLDNINVEHEQLNVKHYGELSDNIDITNTFYYNKTRRNWFKLESVNGASTADILDTPEEFFDEYSWITGEDSSEGAFALRNNRRSYSSRGVQSVLGVDFKTGEVTNELELGSRYHYDYEDRFQEDNKYTMERGSLGLSELGLPGSNANRKGEADAWAFYVQDKIGYGKFTLTPGLRYENINFKRSDWGKIDPLREGTDLKRHLTSSEVFIPGVGAHYAVTHEFGAFAGAHKGFSPPGPTDQSGIQEEESINYETGLSYARDSFGSEFILFYNDYDNLLGADTASSGGTGSGDLFNAGRAKVYGVELSGRYDLLECFDLGFKAPVYANYTFTRAEFDDNFDSTHFGLVESGDSIPYIPDHQISSGIAIEKDKIALALNMHYVDVMSTAVGMAGERDAPHTDSHVVFDTELSYKVKGDKAKVFFLVENLFDEEYIVALRPAGARPGRPRTFLAGFKVAI